MKNFTIMFTCSGGGLSAELRRRLLASSKYNIKIIAVDNKVSKNAQIFCDQFALVPLGDEKNYTSRIEELVVQHKINMVMPCSDEEALSLSKEREKIEKHNCILACVNFEVLKILSSKINTYNFLKEHNIQTPEFYEVNSLIELEESVSLLLEKNIDVVVKPSSGRGGRNVSIISKNNNKGCISYSQFIKNNIKLYNNCFPLIVMEKLKEPIYDVDLLSWRGDIKRSVVRRRINPNIPNDGHIIENITSMHELAKNLAKIFNLSWLYDCDVMMDSKGAPMILEINPQPSGSVAVTIAAGINFIDDMIDLSKDKNIDLKSLPDGKIIIPYMALE